VSKGIVDIAGQRGRQAFDQMVARGIPPTPQNYAVWYAYVSQDRQVLKKAVDVVISNNREFTEEINDDLYQEYFGMDRHLAAVFGASSSLEHLVQQLNGVIGDAERDTGSYGETLKGIGQQLKTGDASKVGTVVSDLIKATAAMASRNAELHARVVDSGKETEALKEKLAAVQKESQMDGLTEIPNRKAFDRTLTAEATMAMETGADLALMMLDVDHFKKFNDSWGHQVGDQVLKFVAKAIEDLIRPTDTPARYGGEEFAVIMPGTTIEAARLVGERIRMAIGERRLVKRSTNEPLGQVTISSGIALFELGEPVQKFLRRADEALYHAKRTGRNRVCSEKDLASAKGTAA